MILLFPSWEDSPLLQFYKIRPLFFSCILTPGLSLTQIPRSVDRVITLTLFQFFKMETNEHLLRNQKEGGLGHQKIWWTRVGSISGSECRKRGVLFYKIEEGEPSQEGKSRIIERIYTKSLFWQRTCSLLLKNLLRLKSCFI